MVEKIYADRDPAGLEPWYSQHVNAMTAEGLHSKADIAAELAWRDSKLEECDKARSYDAEAFEKRLAVAYARNRSVTAERDALKHDLERYMDIANSECNRAESLQCRLETERKERTTEYNAVAERLFAKENEVLELGSRLDRIRQIGARFDRSEIDDVDALTEILEALSDE